MGRSFAALFAFLLAAPSAHARAELADTREAVRDAIEAYGEGEYEFALNRLREAESAPAFAQLAAAERVVIHKYIAYCEVAFERRDAAKAAFLSALAIDPGLEFDVDKVSPKILEVFREAKRESSAALGSPDETVAVPAPTATPLPGGAEPAEKRRLDASLLVPGLPQLSRGETGRGLAFLGAAALSVGALAHLHQTSLVADRHVRDAGPLERAEMRDQAREVRTARAVAIVPVALVWGLSAWDGSRPRVAASLSRDGGSIAIAWSF